MTRSAGLLGPGPREEFGETAVGPVVDELGQDVGEVGLGIDAVQLAGLDQRGQTSPIFRPSSLPAKRAFLRLRATGRINPEAYFTDVLTKLVNNWPNRRLADLLPWAWTSETR